MPYIKHEDRARFMYTPVKHGPNNFVDMLYTVAKECNSPGDLNYVFTVIAQEYLKQQGVNYQHVNDCVGALEGAKMELYRRIAAPYEDEKIHENGDVKRV